jgi:hypothetical protein
MASRRGTCRARHHTRRRLAHADRTAPLRAPVLIDNISHSRPRFQASARAGAAPAKSGEDAEAGEDAEGGTQSPAHALMQGQSFERDIYTEKFPSNADGAEALAKSPLFRSF